jgi:hypothetical protein
VSDEITHARVGCGPVGVGLVALLLGCCVLLTIGSGLVILFPGPVVDFLDRDDDEPDRLRAALGSDGTPVVEVDQAEPVGSASNPAALGATVEGDGLAVTVNGVSRAASIAEATPEPGFVFLLVEVSIRNTSGDAKNYNSYYWSARDIVAGENYDDEKNIRPGNALIAGSLGSGDQVTGNVLLVVPADALVLRLKYDTSPLGGDNLYWLYRPGQGQADGRTGATPAAATPVTP